MPTIAIISCADTKLPEMLYLRDQINTFQCNTILIDTSTKECLDCEQLDIQAPEISMAADFNWDNHTSLSKDRLLDIMCRGLSVLLPRLYAEGRIQGAISIGGLQNTLIGCSGLRALPIGIPKVMVSTVATGNRKFDLITGTKDVTVMPSISDFAGLNTVSRLILSNAAAAIAGMALYAGRPLSFTQSAVIGTTLMGATNDGVVQAATILQDQGFEVLSFHSTGIGGKTMEEMIREGFITAALDLTLHEIVYEYFGSGFGYGANGRLLSGARAGIPMVICPAGIDFICLERGTEFPQLEQRKKILHNSTLLHVKLLPDEVLDVCRIIISRINSSSGKVKVLFPLQGLRSYTQKGEPLYDPAVDHLILQTFQNELRKDIPLITIDCNFMDLAFSKLAAAEMLSILV